MQLCDILSLIVEIQDRAPRLPGERPGIKCYSDSTASSSMSDVSIKLHILRHQVGQ